MRYQCLKVLLVSFCALLFWAVLTPAYSYVLPDFRQLVVDNSPAVVNISTTQKVQIKRHLPPQMQIPNFPDDSPLNDFFRHFFGDEEGQRREYNARSLGSGFIISQDGYVLTNHHVIRGADEIIVRLSDRRQLVAEVVGSDARSDVALLKIDAKDLPVAKIGDSSKLDVGEWVLAIGSPFGFDHSATAGIVSAKGRSLPRENYVPFIQTDVAINPGNSGGPLFNLEGKVVGVNSQIYSRTGGYMGLSFAIPIEVAMDVVEQLKTKGRVSRGWLGVLIQDVTRNLAESFGMSKPQGALVAQVLSDSPAEQAGFKVGDIITEFDGKEIIRSSNLPPIVGSSSVGERVRVKVVRNGKTRELKVRLGELPDEQAQLASGEPETTPADRLAVVVAELTQKQRKDLEVENGVLVKKVGEGAAAEAGIHTGDVILMVNDTKVKDVEHFQEIVEGLEDGSSVPVLVKRKGGPTFLALKLPQGK
ncbi:MAG: DegQ family serine endoprotease [Gammaproteobacteria bacterium]